MLIAVIGGMHGNAAALDAALHRIDAQGIHTVLCTGNLAAGGDDGNRVIDRLRERRVTCVQGELDRLTVRALRKADSLRKRLSGEEFASLQRAHETLTSGNLEFLRALPHRLALTIEGKSLCLCHGTVASQSNVLRADDSSDQFRRQREAANSNIIICGSDVDAFARVMDETLFINPGPLHVRGCAASFVVATTDDESMSADVVRVVKA
jgi:predicted phosphodiesterase